MEVKNRSQTETIYTNRKPYYYISIINLPSNCKAASVNSSMSMIDTKKTKELKEILDRHGRLIYIFHGLKERHINYLERNFRVVDVAKLPFGYGPTIDYVYNVTVMGENYTMNRNHAKWERNWKAFQKTTSYGLTKQRLKKIYDTVKEVNYKTPRTALQGFYRRLRNLANGETL